MHVNDKCLYWMPAEGEPNDMLLFTSGMVRISDKNGEYPSFNDAADSPSCPAYSRTPIPLADFLELPAPTPGETAPTPGETAPTPGETAPTQRDTPSAALPPRTKGQLTPYPRNTPPDDTDEGDALDSLHEIVEEDEAYGQHPPALTPAAELASPAPHDTASTVLPTIHSLRHHRHDSTASSPESATSNANAKPSASPTRRTLVVPTSVGASPPPSAFSTGTAASPTASVGRKPSLLRRAVAGLPQVRDAPSDRPRYIGKDGGALAPGGQENASGAGVERKPSPMRRALEGPTEDASGPGVQRKPSRMRRALAAAGVAGRAEESAAPAIGAPMGLKPSPLLPSGVQAKTETPANEIGEGEGLGKRKTLMRRIRNRVAGVRQDFAPQ
ncbi:hypothetical protein C8J57DRAFT_1494994 [Mycena rebaudengoi]|nr:hypothetical protein C8J57DRAFT_1494994 [Mycena rebaudengoi]